MRRLVGLLVVSVSLLWMSATWAANSVVVESRTAATNAVNCPIRVRLVNDLSLMGVVVPLVIREVTPGSYISAMRLSWDDRLSSDGPLTEVRTNQLYAEPNGLCRPGGFGPAASASDTLKHPVAASPEGVMFAAIRLFEPDLAPGSDVTGSMVLWLDMTGSPGTFEIDTTCVDPANHLTFASVGIGYPIVPDFTKGVITTETNTPPAAICRNVTVAAGAGCAAEASIDNGSYDPDGDAITIDQAPPGPYPLGETAVQLTVTDARNVTSTCQAVVTVVDATPPVLSCPYDTVIVLPPNEPGVVVEYDASATDECSSFTTTVSPPSGSFFPVGVSTVTLAAIDAAGNADTCRFFVAVGSSGFCNDHPNDVNCDGFLDVFDMNQIIDVLFMGAAPPGPCCNVDK